MWRTAMIVAVMSVLGLSQLPMCRPTWLESLSCASASIGDSCSMSLTVTPSVGDILNCMCVVSVASGAATTPNLGTLQPSGTVATFIYNQTSTSPFSLHVLAQYVVMTSTASGQTFESPGIANHHQKCACQLWRGAVFDTTVGIGAVLFGSWDLIFSHVGGVSGSASYVVFGACGVYSSTVAAYVNSSLPIPVHQVTANATAAAEPA